MKKLTFFIAITITLILIHITSVHPCPTCIGRLEKDSPPFFSKEYLAQHTQVASNDLVVQAAEDESDYLTTQE
jgi:hypothetical protein